MIRRIPPLLLAVGLALILTAGIAAVWLTIRPAPSYVSRGPGDRYLALGDSLAWGFRLERPEVESYPARIHAALEARGPIGLTNLAVPGETSASFLQQQLPEALELIAAERSAGRRVSPITLDIGGNDLRAVERAGDIERAAAVEEVRSNLRLALRELRRAAPDADLALMTYYDPYGGDPADPAGEAIWVARLNDVIREEAARVGAAVAEAEEPFSGGRAYSYTYILIGDIHANAQGHMVIAEQFLAALYGPDDAGAVP